MRRRRLIAGATATLVAMATGRSARAAPCVGRDALRARALRLVQAVRRPRSAAVVGRAYLGQRPEEAHIDALVETLSRDLEGGGCDPGTSTKAALRQAVARQVRQDFAQARTVGVQGWVLSVTEARLCGLAALTGT